MPGAAGGFTWVEPNVWKDNPDNQTVRKRLHDIYAAVSDDPAKVIVCAYPGFNDVYATHYPSIDHRRGEVLRQTLDATMAGPWQIVQLVTWNDYGEGTMIEPTHEFGYTFLEIIQAARKRESGSAFTFTPEDLRLPTRLYALRKDGQAPATTLGHIGQLLLKGDCTQARAALDKLGP